MRIQTLLIAALVAAAACSKDSTPATAPTPTNTANGFTIVIDSGFVDAQTLPVATVLPVRAKVTQGSAPAANATVTWSVTGGHGAVSTATTTTDAKGIATVNWTLGDTVGVNTVAAVSNGASVTFSASGTAGPAASLLKQSPDSQAVVAGASLPITVRARDKFGNAASGLVVTWAAATGALSTKSTTSGITGNATVNFTTAAATTYTVTATAQGIGSVSFKIVGF